MRRNFLMTPDPSLVFAWNTTSRHSIIAFRGRGSCRDSIYIRASKRSSFKLVSVIDIPPAALAGPPSHLPAGTLNIEELTTVLAGICYTAVAIPCEVLSSKTQRAAGLELATLKQNAYPEYL